MAKKNKLTTEETDAALKEAYQQMYEQHLGKVNNLPSSGAALSIQQEQALAMMGQQDAWEVTYKKAYQQQAQAQAALTAPGSFMFTDAEINTDPYCPDNIVYIDGLACNVPVFTPIIEMTEGKDIVIVKLTGELLRATEYRKDDYIDLLVEILKPEFKKFCSVDNVDLNLVTNQDAYEIRIRGTLKQPHSGFDQWVDPSDENLKLQVGKINEQLCELKPSERVVDSASKIRLMDLILD